MPEAVFPRADVESANPADLIVRSPVVGWIFVVAGMVSLASGALLVPQVLGRPTPFTVGVMVGCFLYTLLCAGCWLVRRQGRYGVESVGVFAWATITFIAASAVPQRSGVNTVGFLVLPAFVFMITVLGQRRLSLATLAYTAAVFGGVGFHHALDANEIALRSSALSNMVIAAGLILTFAALGHQVAQIVAQQVSRANEVAAHYRALFQRLPLAALLVVDGRIVDHNEQAGELFNPAGAHALRGRPFFDLIPQEERAATKARMAGAAELRQGEHLPLRDLEMNTLGGTVLPVTVTSVSLDPSRRMLLSMIIDRTRQDQTHRELLQTQRLVQALFSVSAHTMAVTDRQTGEFLLVNPAYARAVGREPQEILGRTSVELKIVEPEDRETFVRALDAKGTAELVRLNVKGQDGQIRELRQSLTTTRFDGREVLVAVGRDVTDEARRERELRAILASAPSAIYVVRHGVVTAVSAQYERLLRLPEGAGVGRRYDLDIGGPKNMERLAQSWQPAMRAGGIVTYEHPVFRHDGTQFPGRLTGRLIKPGAKDGFGMVWVIEDMTEQMEREAQMARAKSDAEAASRAKSGFLATMSHEIRTPLNGILGLIELVRDPLLDQPTRQQYLELMTESAQSLQEIVSDVLDVSRIEAGLMPLESKPFELGSWLASLRAAYSALVEAKGLTLNVQSDPACLGWVQGDPVRLRQILTNYLSNALKFTLSGAITIGLSRLSPTRVRLEVTDTGLGIPADALPQLFKPFSQAGRTQSLVRGSGLGLSICRQLAERMGGTTGATSVHGQGSCFWVEVDLPAVDGPLADEAAPMIESSLQGLRLLVVDDNRINLVVARRLLERAGAEVEVADGGQAALDAVDAAQKAGAPFDLVVMDVQMPEMNGMEALAALRTRPHGMTLPVLAASAAVTTEEVDLTRAAGFDGFVSKPLELSALLRSVLEAARRRVELRF